MPFKDPEKRNEYHKKYRETHYYKYVGIVICPKCERKGYKSYSRHYNKKTGNYTSIFTKVRHKRTEDGKTMYDGICYIGMGEL